MPRSLDSTLAANIQKPNVALALLASFAFKSQTVYCWTGYGDLTWSGMTFKGIGTLGKIGGVGNGEADVVESGTTVSLSGIDSLILGECLTDCTPNGAVKIWLATWANGGLSGTPYLLWQGFLGQPRYSGDVNKVAIELQLSTSLAQMSRATCRRYTSADQRIYHPDDISFVWVEPLNDQTLRWGG